jgi:hypothetical protein
MTGITDSLDLILAMCPGWGVENPPVGISSLKGFLEKHRISVKCLDLSLDLYAASPEKKYWNLNYPEHFMVPKLFKRNIQPLLGSFIEKWARQILSYNPKAVGFSLFMSSISVSLLLAQELRKLSPDLIILGGGPEVTRLKRVLIDGIQRVAHLNKGAIAGDIFNALVEGEGEETLLEIMSLIKQGRDFHSARGILYTENGRSVCNQARGLIRDLDILPAADYHDLELANYSGAFFPLVTSRGCVNRCAFCADSPLWKVYRCRSAEKVLEEIGILIREYGRKKFEIIDSTFNGDLTRVSRICDLLISSGLDLEWSAKAILKKDMSYELLEKMGKAGCRSLAYGVESGSPRVLKEMHKNIDLDAVKRIIRDTHRAGIQASCFFLVGYPTETEKDFQMTLDFIQENAEFIYCFDQITGCHIEEDSYLGLHLAKYGIVFKEDGWHNRESTPAIRRERLERFKGLANRLHKQYQYEVQQ